MDIIIEDGQEDVSVNPELVELQEDLEDIQLSKLPDSPASRTRYEIYTRLSCLPNLKHYP